MSSTPVIGTTKQKTVYDPYFPGCEFTIYCTDCSGQPIPNSGGAACPNSHQACTRDTDQRSCDSDDWFYELLQRYRGPCPDQPACSNISQVICPNIGGSTGTVEWTTPNTTIDNQIVMIPISGGGREVNCTYNMSDFKTGSDIEAWVNTFGTGGAYNTIMSTFCRLPGPSCRVFSIADSIQTSTVCPNGLTGCSMFSDTGTGGFYCQQWLAQSVTGADSTATSFCSANICAQDCLCYNRSDVDPIFEQISNNLGSPDFPDACWYEPCKNSTYLIPADEAINISTCPSDVCQQVTNVIGNIGSNINIPIAKQSISCLGGGGGVGTDILNYIETIWDQYHVWIIIGAAILLTTVILLIVIAIIKNSRKKKEVR